MSDTVRLQLLSRTEYVGINAHDPIRFYYLPILGAMYRRRVELCLAECTGGERVLEIGFGSGVTFLNLAQKYREIHGLDLTADATRIGELFKKRGIQTDLRNGSVLALPYADGMFDTVLLISVLEHLKPDELRAAFAEIRRVLKPGGQVVYGVPIERPMMVLAFRLLGEDIRRHHFSTEADVCAAAGEGLWRVRVVQMKSSPSIFGAVYEVGHFQRPG